VVGDTHGNFTVAKFIVNQCFHTIYLDHHYRTVVFLGDYVDRGPQQIENINYLFLVKALFPQRIVLIRGNHEDPSVNERFGFKTVVTDQFSEKLYEAYNRVFSNMPVLALTWNRIIMLHGGITEGFESLSQVKEISKGISIYDDQILQGMLWNDPGNAISGFQFNFKRGIHSLFGEDVFTEFMSRNNLSRMIRSHEFCKNGYEWHFKKRLLTIFSYPNYNATSEGAMVEITEEGAINIIHLPKEK